LDVIGALAAIVPFFLLACLFQIAAFNALIAVAMFSVVTWIRVACFNPFIKFTRYCVLLKNRNLLCSLRLFEGFQ
jgi:hypothetical protein